MSKAHRLCHLQVRKTRHHRVCMSASLTDKCLLQLLKQFILRIDHVTQPETDISCDLIVARSGCMQALARIADQQRQPSFDVEMNVLQVDRPDKLMTIDFCLNLGHALNDRIEISAADDALFTQHLCMGKRCPDVCLC